MQGETRDPEHRLRRKVFAGISLLVVVTVVLVGIAAFRGHGFDWSLGVRTRIVRHLLAAEGWTILELERRADGTFELTGYSGESFCVGSAKLKPPILRPRVETEVNCGATEPISQAERNCRRGLPSCSSAANLHRTATPPNLPAAIRFSVLGCDQNQLYACIDAGYLLEEVDPARAARAFRRACDLGQDGSCTRLGDILDGARGTQYRDAVAACDAFERAWLFRYTNQYAATKLALCFESGLGRPQDLARSSRVLAEACSLQSETACAHISENRILGRGTPRDVARGRAELESRCEAGRIAHCEVLARLLEEGVGLPKDPTVSVPLRARCCEHASLESCLIAEGAYVRGAPGIPPDPARARALRERYCYFAGTCDGDGDAVPTTGP